VAGWGFHLSFFWFVAFEATLKSVEENKKPKKKDEGPKEKKKKYKKRG
jgi:hypothetical protein